MELFPYIPFYIARYEAELAEGRDVVQAMRDLEYFRDELLRLHDKGELSNTELIDLTGFVNTIITHITDGNKAEEGLVKVMGGVILETESERLIRIGEERGEKRGERRGEKRGEKRGELRGREEGICCVVETCQDLGVTFEGTLGKLMEKFGMTEAEAMEKMKRYWK